MPHLKIRKQAFNMKEVGGESFVHISAEHTLLLGAENERLLALCGVTFPAQMTMLMNAYDYPATCPRCLGVIETDRQG